MTVKNLVAFLWRHRFDAPGVSADRNRIETQQEELRRARPTPASDESDRA